MKKLSIEEKAKRYDEAIKVAKSNYETIVQMDNDCTFAKEGIVNTFHHMFPELKESEDEKIRKHLISLVKNWDKDGIVSKYTSDANDIKQILAWLEKQDEPVEINPTEFDTRLQTLIGKFGGLPKEELIGSLSFWMNVVQNDGTYREEKQGEQKPADNVEPKFNFKVGQWIVATGKCVYLIAKIDGFNVTLVDTNGDEYVFDASSLDDARQWTIQDAKDGDVLATEDTNFTTPFVAIYKSLGDTVYKELKDNITFNSRCFIGFNGIFYKGEEGHAIENIHPATKEQCDTLEKAMVDAGYVFDFKKKELKKIEQNPTRSEKDSPYYDDICEILINILHSETTDVNKDAVQKDLDWLKSLKDKLYKVKL